MLNKFFDLLQGSYNKAREEPYSLVPAIVALLNGYWHKMKFFLLGKKVKIGGFFRVYGTFKIIGPGAVVIGDNCGFDGRLFGPVAFRTDLPSATIRIGDNTGLHGTTIQCFSDVIVGDGCLIADAYLTDSSGHSLSIKGRHLQAKDVLKQPVTIGENVWIGTKAVILHGVTIGKNSVVGACSLVRHDVAPNSFYAGNPATFIKDIGKEE